MHSGMAFGVIYFRESAFAKVDEFLLEHSALGEKARACGTSDVMAGVLVVYTKMDSIL
jgi:Golgi phosphoprotein 3